MMEGNKVGNTSLITVTHDPKGKNVELFNELKSGIEGIYSELFITISEESSTKLIDALEDSLFNTKIIPKLGAANARR
ncbi:hypothetical protein, partial [Pseudomonas sp. 2822-17]|uniref:hypothetical protein n=1 Tax=Pseudomonas sp. 2822-17 TaxID=1712678 RepID=UPI00117A9BAC